MSLLDATKERNMTMLEALDHLRREALISSFVPDALGGLVFRRFFEFQKAYVSELSSH